MSCRSVDAIVVISPLAEWEVADCVDVVEGQSISGCQSFECIRKCAGTDATPTDIKECRVV